MEVVTERWLSRLCFLQKVPDRSNSRDGGSNRSHGHGKILTMTSDEIITIKCGDGGGGASAA